MKSPIFGAARDRLAKATPGPWIARYHDRVATAEDVDGTKSLVHLYNTSGHVRENQAFIAHAPTDLERALKVIDVLTECLSEFDCYCDADSGCDRCIALFKAENIAEGVE